VLRDRLRSEGPILWPGRPPPGRTMEPSGRAVEHAPAAIVALVYRRVLIAQGGPRKEFVGNAAMPAAGEVAALRKPLGESRSRVGHTRGWKTGQRKYPEGFLGLQGFLLRVLPILTRWVSRLDVRKSHEPRERLFFGLPGV